jgi:quinoprotein glucose dehydrogenase
VFALDPARGLARWTYDAHIDLHGDYGDFATRGVSTWLDGAAAAGASCRRRIFLATVDARLIALDAATGRPCADFGAAGTVALERALRHQPHYPGEYEVTSPPAVVGDLVIVGSAIADNHRTDAPDGMVRAFDARSGRERWRWDPVTPTQNIGAANAWSVISVDAAHDLVFIPVGSASPDFYGGERLGDNRWANAVVALRASTGKFVWGFQVVHHDLWDLDVPAQPVLFTLRRDGKNVPALAQVTKMGHVFILDRLTGVPLFPVEERAVPASDVPGEMASPTQPFPPAAFRLVPESLPPADAWGPSPDAQAQCRDRLGALRSEGIFTPPSLKGTAVYPGNLGGGNWSAAAVDEARGLLLVPTNHLPFIITLVPRDGLMAAHDAHPGSEVGRQLGTPYAMLRDPFLGPDHVPCSPPPWGTLTALDLTAGTVKWQVPLGSAPWLAQLPGAGQWGSLNIGGAMVTAGGLVFIAATWDHHLRALDVETGRELWSAALPVGAYAMPMTYAVDGRQFVVISAGGHDRLDPSGLGDYVLAFTMGGAGAPALDTAAHSAAGSFSGEIRTGEDRHPAHFTLRANGDSLIGEFDITDPLAAGTVSGRQRGDTVVFTAPFHSSEKKCDGAFAGRGEIADGGRLFVGRVLLTGPCSGTPPDSGTFGVWRHR